mmetsp:Transcript_9894/g.21971  ORF Transcript_9894/g.21971 Transcript_9894/m.21971 type:complete len:110 (-) Transcript_9894:2-331(-)
MSRSQRRVHVKSGACLNSSLSCAKRQFLPRSQIPSKKNRHIFVLRKMGDANLVRNGWGGGTVTIRCANQRDVTNGKNFFQPLLLFCLQHKSQANSGRPDGTSVFQNTNA